MTTGLYTHRACLEHDTGHGHPERIQRLQAVLRLLDDPIYATLERRDAPAASREQLARVHTEAYIDEVFAAIPSIGYGELDGDTVLSPGSGEAALRAAGAVTAAVDAVIGGAIKNAFCAVRPPGHHAERDLAMGFCIFNNVAIGAAQAIAVHGLSRVAIFDFDVHHGNGTQHIFAAEPRVLYASTHQSPLYPGTGAKSEKGVGNIVNAPLAPYAGSEEFRDACETIILPAIEKFRPELIMISAGFDAHRADPLASLELETEDFAWITDELVKLAAECCSGRIVSTLEGGYDLNALAESATAHVYALQKG
ncbi:histone deacetylase family protein [Dongia sp.]|uniref:histone deacetylase family protein n=1 Tax=Dongia sp. TaxID=1977262 RepID=UPI0035AFB16B